MTDFIKRRYSKTAAYGRKFSEGIIVALLFFLLFLNIAIDISSGQSLRIADQGILNLVADLRTIPGANFYLFVTYFGNWQFVVTIGLIAITILLIFRKWRMAKFLLVGTIGGYAVREFLKFIVKRNRPIGYSWVPTTGYSFPSGHAFIATIFYGLIGYFLYRTVKKRWQKTLIVLATLIVIFLIGYSRVYLGAHWFFDVVGGWAAGFSMLMFLRTFYNEFERNSPSEKKLSVFSDRFIYIFISLVVLLEVIFVLFYYNSHPLIVTVPEIQQKIVLNSYDDLLSAISSDQFPKFSETLTGKKMEPASFIVVGSESDLTQMFHDAGWFSAEKPVGTIFRLARAAFLNRPYPTAPVTPSFLNNEPQAIAFEKPTATNSARQRHHTRYWLTSYELSGKPVWIATASFDTGLRYLVTHRIDPDIDKEREFIKNDLSKTDFIKEIQKIQLVVALTGSNAGGDAFYTDGQAYVIVLK